MVQAPAELLVVLKISWHEHPTTKERFYGKLPTLSSTIKKSRMTCLLDSFMSKEKLVSEVIAL